MGRHDEALGMKSGFVKLRMAHYISYGLFGASWSCPGRLGIHAQTIKSAHYYNNDMGYHLGCRRIYAFCDINTQVVEFMQQAKKVHITIIMAWAVMTKPGWGRANYHTNCGNSHANCVGVPNSNNNSNEFPNTFAS